MEMTPVNSTALEAVGYDPASNRMRIRFTGGNSYDFCRLPAHVHRDLMTASSMGAFYNEHIKDRYPCH